MTQLGELLVLGLPPQQDADDPGPVAFPLPAAQNGNGKNGHAANGHAASNGHAAAAPIPALAIPVNANGESVQDIAMKAAIDVCCRGQKYADSKGLKILFSGEDVRCVMNTIQINLSDRAKGYR